MSDNARLPLRAAIADLIRRTFVVRVTNGAAGHYVRDLSREDAADAILALVRERLLSDAAVEAVAKALYQDDYDRYGFHDTWDEADDLDPYFRQARIAVDVIAALGGE